MTRISSDVDIIRMFSSNGLALMLRALLMIIGSTVLVLLANWQLSIIMFVCLIIAGILIWTFMSIASPLFNIVQQKLAALNTVIQENLAGTHRGQSLRARTTTKLTASRIATSTTWSEISVSGVFWRWSCRC